MKDRMVFLVGARRSGTNWLQRILDAHPDVASVPSESGLFSHGIAPLTERFQQAAIASPRPGAVYMDHDALLDALRDFCDTVFASLREALGPRAERLVERTPDHVRHLALIGEVYPDAYVVHIVRDGRDVARSLVSQPWGPETIAEAAAEWRSAIETARADAPKLERYLEVRYEDLLADAGRVIGDVFERLGLDASPDIVRRAFDEAGVRFNVDPAHSTVGAGKWRDTFSRSDVKAFARVAGPTLVELGYANPGELDTAPAPGPRTEARPGPQSLGSTLVAAVRRRTTGKVTRARVRAGLVTVERFLAAITSRRAGDLGAFLAPNAYVRVVGVDDSREARGTAGLELLRDAVSNDEALAGRQLAGDIHPGLPTFTFVGSFVAPDGRRSDRVIVAGVEEQSIVRCVYYRLG